MDGAVDEMFQFVEKNCQESDNIWSARNATNDAIALFIQQTFGGIDSFVNAVLIRYYYY